jgi:tetratricopeptide (TPR) repeat protein
MKAALLALFLLLPSAAQAADAIFSLYARGAYEEAARAGEAAHTASGYAIAARAVLADEVLRGAPCMACLQRAETLARQAVAADPHFAYGQVWLAVALGYESRITGIVKARLRDAPAQSRAALEQAVKDDPKNPYALSALGGWHIEVVRGGGSYLARTLYGARESDALALFDRALHIAPDNVAVHYQIALSLAGFDADKYRARIKDELQAVAKNDAATAHEKKMQQRAAELLALQDTPDNFAARVRKYQGFPD